MAVRELTALYEEIADCPNCALARTRTQTVPGTGPAPADVMCIGEAPGAREDATGEPFVGPAGAFWTSSSPRPASAGSRSTSPTS